MKLAHKHEGNWAYIPILGYEEMDNDVNIASLHYRNPAARQLFENGLVCVGQLFKVNDLGFICASRPKSRAEVQDEIGVFIPAMIWNALLRLKLLVAQRFRAKMLSVQVRYQEWSTLIYLIRATNKGCSCVTRLILKEERANWSWGPYPRAYTTYRNDGLINISAEDYSIALKNLRKNILMPSVHWTSFMIFIR